MANALHPDEIALWHKHHDNVVTSLNRRLEVAKANHDTRLIELLEQEQRQLERDEDRHTSWGQQLSSFWDDLLALLRGDADVRVWQTVDREGDRWWCAYNPQTGQSLYTDSEAEMRMWIEDHYSEVH